MNKESKPFPYRNLTAVCGYSRFSFFAPCFWYVLHVFYLLLLLFQFRFRRFSLLPRFSLVPNTKYQIYWYIRTISTDIICILQVSIQPYSVTLYRFSFTVLILSLSCVHGWFGLSFLFFISPIRFAYIPILIWFFVVVACLLASFVERIRVFPVPFIILYFVIVFGTWIRGFENNAVA